MNKYVIALMQLKRDDDEAHHAHNIQGYVACQHWWVSGFDWHWPTAQQYLHIQPTMYVCIHFKQREQKESSCYGVSRYSKIEIMLQISLQHGTIVMNNSTRQCCIADLNYFGLNTMII